MKTKLFVGIILALGLISKIAYAEAPRIIVAGPREVPVAGSEFTVKILLDSAEPLNAYSLEMIYSPRNLEIVNLDTSHSIIDIWQTPPVVTGDGRINFSGGSTVPFHGSGGELLSVRFKALKAGRAELNLESAAVYLADGKGTKVTPSVSSAIMENSEIAEDKIPPEIKFLSFVPDPYNSDQNILSFSVFDSGSGVRETLVRSRTLFWWSGWQTLTSTVALPKNVWAVDFKATDNKNNYSEKVVYEWGALGHLLVSASLAAIIMLLAFWVIVKFKKGRS